MAKKYLTEDNIKNILSGIKAKIPKELEVSINTNVNMTKVELLDSPVTLTVNSWGSVVLNQSVLNFDEIEVEFAINLGSNIQFRKYTISKSIISSMTVNDRYLEALVIDAIVASDKISQYARVIMRVDVSDYSKLEFNAGFGGTSFTANIVAIRGINYTQSCGDTPLGTIINYIGITPPDEYLACDGTTYLINQYWELAEFIKSQFGTYNYFGGNGTTTFAVPDLRGEFLRGTGTNSHANQGNGDSVGAHQDGTEHTVFVSGIPNSELRIRNCEASSYAQLDNVNRDSSLSGNKNQSSLTVGAVSNSNVTADYAYTSRPTNTSVLYCIKYTNSPSMQPSNVYSTEEKRIGTWIDGKPLYQIVYKGVSGATVANSLEVIKNISSLNIDMLIDLKGTVYTDTTSGSTYQFPAICSFTAGGTTSFTTLSFDKATGNLYQAASTNYINRKLNITIQYTKNN